jgi:predicted transcriptional regulator
MRQKVSYVSFRVLADEKSALAEMARIDRRNLSEMMRECIRQEAARRGFWPPKDEELRVEHARAN